VPAVRAGLLPIEGRRTLAAVGAAGTGVVSRLVRGTPMEPADKEGAVATGQYQARRLGRCTAEAQTRASGTWPVSSSGPRCRKSAECSLACPAHLA